MINKHPGKYLPALSYAWLTPLYDPILRWTMRDTTFKRRLVAQAQIERGHRVLDLGCGTATLTLLIKKAYPEAEVVGLDGDLRIIKVAKAKVAKAGLDISLVCGLSFALPYADSSLDRVLSSLLFHHLNGENKVATLREMLRILCPGGRLLIADLGPPDNVLMYFISLIMGRLEETTDNVMGLLPKMCQDAGFVQVEETARYSTVFGTLSFYKALKPE